MMQTVQTVQTVQTMLTYHLEGDLETPSPAVFDKVAAQVRWPTGWASRPGSPSTTSTSTAGTCRTPCCWRCTWRDRRSGSAWAAP